MGEKQGGASELPLRDEQGGGRKKKAARATPPVRSKTLFHDPLVPRSSSELQSLSFTVCLPQSEADLICS